VWGSPSVGDSVDGCGRHGTTAPTENGTDHTYPPCATATRASCWKKAWTPRPSANAQPSSVATTAAIYSHAIRGKGRQPGFSASGQDGLTLSVAAEGTESLGTRWACRAVKLATRLRSTFCYNATACVNVLNRPSSMGPS
jgi:hypothetical protein